MLFVSKPQADNFALNYLNHMDCERYVGRDMIEVSKLIQNHDVVWYEWANDFTATCVNMIDHGDTKIMVRVHDHEIRKGRIKHINWEKVDYIWFINQDAQRDFNRVMNTSCKQFFLPNAVDTTPYKFNPTNNKHIGFLSIYARKRKRIDRAIEVMRHLIELDPEWKMTIRLDPAGGTPEMTNHYYKYKQLAHGLPITFETHTIDLNTYGDNREDVNNFFTDKSVVLSTSDHEGFHYAVAEGVSCGCVPVVYNWEWGRAGDFWNPNVFSKTKEMAHYINRISQFPGITTFAKFAFDRIENRFSPKVLIEKLQEEIA